MRKWLFVILFSAVSVTSTLGQDVIGARTLWSDSFREWELVTPQEYRSSKLYMRWPSRDDWSQWDFRMGDTIAEMKLKWQDDPNLWEVRCNGVTVTARTLWAGDFSEWRLEDGNHKIVWKTKFGNTAEEWVMRNKDNGVFSVYTYWEGDPREWVVYDNLEEDVSYAMRLTMIFISLIHSTPRI